MKPARSTARIRTRSQVLAGARTPFEGEKIPGGGEIRISSRGSARSSLSGQPRIPSPISLQAKDKAIQDLLQLKTIQVVPKDTKGSRSTVFTVPMLDHYQEYGKRFIFDIKVSISLVTLSGRSFCSNPS